MVIMEEINSIFDYAQEINIYNNGVKCIYSCGSNIYKQILKGWENLIDGARLMPAFGVSLNHLTVAALKEGLWVEFDFKKQCEVASMPFEKLLVEVNPQNSGFNIIRYMDSIGYDGRCFYLDLVNKNMAQFYDILNNI